MRGEGVRGWGGEGGAEGVDVGVGVDVSEDHRTHCHLPLTSDGWRRLATNLQHCLVRQDAGLTLTLTPTPTDLIHCLVRQRAGA